MTTAPFDAAMPFFSSVRERRLWAWTLLVVAAIYSTLGLATTLAGLLSDAGVLTPLFVLAMLLIAAAVVTRGLTWRPGGAEIAVALGVAAVYGLVFVRMALETERSHLIEYGVVALLIYEALTERASRGRRVPVPALLAFLAAVVVGTVDEGIQAWLPVRVFDPLDILFNALAAFMAVAGSVALAWARRRTRRLRRTSSDH
ncbi:MAG: VanZ family protein [Chloroflexi bacterium]|nr:VanZ family protein [Chloroflexota bacterium]